MSTYLELCRRFVGEYGIAGGTGPSTTVSQTGELGRVCRWIADAELYVNVLWTDWRFLWRQYSETLTIGSSTAPIHSVSTEPVREYDIRTFYLNKDQDSYIKLDYVEWSDFNGMYNVGARSNQPPNVITMRPDRVLELDYPADAAYTLTADFYVSPTRMSADTDEPMMPEEFERIIIARAAIMYGNKEDAPEIISGAEAEYLDMLEKLEANQLPSAREQRMSESDFDMVVEVE